MAPYLLRRLLQSLLTIFILVSFVFIAARATGDPSTSLLPQTASEEDRADLRRALHLEEPLWLQFADYLDDLAQGELGTSYQWQRPVAGLIAERLPVTLTLGGLAGAISIGLGVPMGIWAARRRGGAADRTIRAIALLGQSVPIFVTALAGILLFAVKLAWLPVAGIDRPIGYVLPAATLGWFGMAAMIRVTRAAMITALGADYIVAARGRGLRERAILYRHALRNALIPVVTLFGLILATLLTGAVVTETMFALPGLGRLAVEAIVGRDFPVVQAIVIVTTAIFILVNLCVDLLYGVLDPRTRRSPR